MKIPSQVRYFNKYVLNHLTGLIARSGWGPFCVIYHVGRKSGKPYETPIIAVPTDHGFVIALTYGPKVDWLRNIRAAGHCRIRLHKRDYPLGEVVPLSAEEGLAAFPSVERKVLRGLGIREFVRINRF